MIKKLVTLALCLNIYNMHAAQAIQDIKHQTKVLLSAIEQNDIAKASDAIAKKANVNSKFDGKSLLTIACLNDKKDMVELLLKNGADVEHHVDIMDFIMQGIIDGSNYLDELRCKPTPLLATYLKGNLEIAKLLIDHEENYKLIKELEELARLLVKAEHDDHNYLCSKFNQEHKGEFIKIILDKINYIPNELPIQACYYANDRSIAQAICSHPLLTDVNEEDEVDDFGTFIEGSLLYVTALQGDLVTAKILIEKGSDIHYVNPHDRNIMAVAIESGNVNLVKYLQSLGLGIDENTLSGLCYNELVTNYAEKYELIKYLLPNFSKEMMKFPLYAFITNFTFDKRFTDEKLTEAYNLLREYKFDVVAKYEGKNALQKVNSMSHVKLLMEHGLNVDHKENGMHSVFNNNFLGGSEGRPCIQKILFDLLKFYPTKINDRDLQSKNWFEAHSRNYSNEYRTIAGLMAKRKWANDNQEQLFNLINHDDKITKAEEAIANLKKFIIDYKISLIAFDDKTGNSTLHHAILCDKPHMANFIMRFARGLVDIPNKNGYTPIELMAAKKHILATFFFKLFK